MGFFFQQIAIKDFFISGSAGFSELEILKVSLSIDNSELWNQLPSMLKLTELYLDLELKNLLVNFELLVKQCPNLSTFYLIVAEFTDENLILILKNLLKLRRFGYASGEAWQIPQSWIGIFVEYGQNLEEIGFTFDYYEGQDPFICNIYRICGMIPGDVQNICFELFEKIPALRMVEDFCARQLGPLLRQDYYKSKCGLGPKRHHLTTKEVPREDF